MATPEPTAAPVPPLTSGQRILASRLTPAVVLVASLVITVGSWRAVVQSQREVATLNFLKQIERIQNRTRERIAECESVMLGAAGLFTVHPGVTRQQWHDYLQGLRANEKLAGVQGIGFDRRIPAAALAADLEQIRADGAPDFTVRPAGPRAEYYPVVYLEPGNARNRLALGFDLASDRVRWEAMTRARDEARMAMSGPITLVQEGTAAQPQAGFLLFLPVYDPVLPQQTAEERRAALRGFISCPIRAGDFLAQILAADPAAVGVEVAAGPDPGTRLYSFRTGASARNLPAGFQPHYRATARLELPGQTWKLEFQSLPDFEKAQQHARAPLTLLVGLLGSLLAAGLVMAQGNRNRHLQRLARLAAELQQARRELESRVEARTAELAEANVQLLRDIRARRKAEEGLARLSAHFQQLLSVASDGIHVLDEEGNVYECSESFQRMLGCSAAEAGALNVRDWDARFEPGRLREMIAEMIRQPAVFETLHRRMNGTVFPVEINAHGIEIDGRKFLYASARDITARKQAESALSASEARFRAVLENSHDPIGVHVDGFWVMCNPAAVRLFGAGSAAELLGQPIAHVIAPAERARIGGYVRNRSQGAAAPAAYLTRGLRKDGGEFDIEVTLSDYRLEGRRHVLVILRDITERNRAEEALRRSRAELLEAQAIAHLGSFVLDPASGRCLVTPQINVIFGLPPAEENTLASWRDAVHPDDLPRALAVYEAGLREGQPFELEYRIFRQSDRQLRWVHGIGKPVRGEAGRITALAGVVMDVTERRLAEQAAQESELRFAAMADAAPVLIWTAGLDQGCNYFNRGWLDFTGRTLAQEMGHGWAEGVHPKDLTRCLEVYVQHFDARRPFRMEYRLRRHDGRYRWILDNGIPRYQADGSFAGYIGSCIDITEKRENEDRLHLQSVAMEMAASAILITNAEGVIEWVNAAFVRISGYTAAEAIGQKPSILKSGLQPASYYREMWDTILSGQVWRGQLRNKHRDGSLFDEESIITPLTNSDGKITHFIAIKTDITERRKGEEALRAASAYARSLIEASLDPLVTIDVTGRITDVNAATIHATGVPRGELIGTDFSNYFTEPARAREGYQRVFAEGSVYDYPLTLRSATGGRMQVLYNATVYRDSHGNVVGVFAAARDITDRQRAETARQEAHDRLLKIASRVPGVVYQFRRYPDGRFAFPFASEGIRDIYGVSPEEVREDGAKVFQALHPEDYPGVVASIQQSARELAPWHHAYRVRLGDGAVRWVSGNAVPQREADGSTLWHGVITDITERMQAQQKLQGLLAQTERDARTKGELLQEVNHRVTNNLSAILGLIVGEGRALDSAEIPVVKPVLDRLALRIRGLLQAHRLLADTQWAPVRVDQLAGLVVRAAIAADPGRRLAEIEIVPAAVEISPRQASNFALILNELTTNTIKYGRLSGQPIRIRVETSLQDDFITVHYQDNGPGFPPEALAGVAGGVGQQLIRQLVTETLRGELTLANESGASVLIRLRPEERHRT